MAPPKSVLIDRIHRAEAKIARLHYKLLATEVNIRSAVEGLRLKIEASRNLLAELPAAPKMKTRNRRQPSEREIELYRSWHCGEICMDAVSAELKISTAAAYRRANVAGFTRAGKMPGRPQAPATDQEARLFTDWSNRLLSTEELAARLGVSKSVVYYRANNRGYPRPTGFRTGKVKPEVERAAKDWAVGESLLKIKARTGISPTSILRAVRILGLHVPSRYTYNCKK